MFTSSHLPSTPQILLLATTLALAATGTPTGTIPAPTSTSTSTSTQPYIGLSIYTGTASAPCDPASLSFNLKPPVAWLSQSPTSHCLPGLPGNITDLTCVTRRTDPLSTEHDTSALDTNLANMAKCDMWGFTQPNCQGEYFGASRDDVAASKLKNGKNGTQPKQSWIWTEEERAAGPDLLDIRSWQIDCHA